MTDHIFTVRSDDACLDGHFPGAPIVPGVVVLDHVGQAVMRRYSGRLVRIARCKFVAALYPEQSCTIELEAIAHYRARFTCNGPDGHIARGVIEWAETGDG